MIITPLLVCVLFRGLNVEVLGQYMKSNFTTIAKVLHFMVFQYYFHIFRFFEKEVLKSIGHSP